METAQTPGIGKRDAYNTPIPPEMQPDFLQWCQQMKQKTGKDPRHDMYDYDVQGYFLSGAWKNPALNGHGPDTFKKPNHPTFSNESIYNTEGNHGGVWGEKDFTPSETNLQYHSPMSLFKYFRDREPGYNVNLPMDRSQQG